MSKHFLLMCATVSALVLVPARGRAETTPTTTINQLTVVTPASDRYRLFHGALWLEFDKATHNYRWGGAQCGGTSLSELQVSMLYAAFRAKDSVNISYDLRQYKKKRYRCITGFTLRRS